MYPSQRKGVSVFEEREEYVQRSGAEGIYSLSGELQLAPEREAGQDVVRWRVTTGTRP